VNSSKHPAILIAAPSGRALAAAARRAGYRPLVADFFDDLDTRALCLANQMIAPSERGFEADQLLAALRALAEGHDPIGLVYGGGFEDRPEILAALARHFKIFGNSPETVAKVKDPARLADLCKKLAIPHPEISFVAPADPMDWLLKHAGGGGGLHVMPALGATPRHGDYYQRRVEGAPVCALLLANGDLAQVLGFSEQWTSPTDERPFHFGGAAQPANLGRALESALTAAATGVAVATGLVGLNSIDFLVDGETYHFIEINPRPGATLDIFADSDGRIFSAHLDACGGLLPQPPLVFSPGSATAIFYAPFDLVAMPQLDWPLWCHDRQKPGTCLHKGDPVCTVAAEAESTAAARALLTERLASFLQFLTENASKEAAA
jgi:uncharacterized protein